MRVCITGVCVGEPCDFVCLHGMGLGWRRAVCVSVWVRCVWGFDVCVSSYWSVFISCMGVYIRTGVVRVQVSCGMWTAGLVRVVWGFELCRCCVFVPMSLVSKYGAFTVLNSFSSVAILCWCYGVLVCVGEGRNRAKGIEGEGGRNRGVYGLWVCLFIRIVIRWRQRNDRL